MNFRNILLFLNLIIFLSSCGVAKDAFSNQKKNNSDEFLVEKKSPLVLPPDYSELPIPNSSEIQDEDDTNKLKKLITNDENNEDKTNKNKKNQNFEKTILEKIKNN
tara:strand:+ start:105 stop:422 length:318 start_codon:yes stop_codon:yes gene_type:complete